MSLTRIKVPIPEHCQYRHISGQNCNKFALFFPFGIFPFLRFQINYFYVLRDLVGRLELSS